MPKHEASEEEKIRILNDGFVYEISVVSNVVELFNTLTVKDKIEALKVRNAFLEAIVLHTRVLLEFFKDDKARRSDDARAADFMRAGEKWIAPDIDRDPKYSHLRQVKDRINKEVTHLTYDRARSQKSLWSPAPILLELFEIIKMFLLKCDKRYIRHEILDMIVYVEKVIELTRH